MTVEASLADTPRHVRITTTATGAAVKVDGTDISNALAAYSIEQRAGQPPMVALRLTPAGTLALDGIAHVVVAEPGGLDAATFLASVDPAALHRAALSRDDLDGSPTELTTAVLRQLLEWTTGART
ncbi:hypothetical protein [Streptomyces sp. NPDC001404]|uniref:hypothetical protein n=1 Tax=Streptomyces sp. NPDC001404 TaxID=3364571 RepID=UPI0036AC26AA